MKYARSASWTLALALALAATFAWAQGSGGGTGSAAGGTGIDSAVQSGGESSSKASRGLARGLEQAFGGLTILNGLRVGRIAPEDFILLGDLYDGGYIIRTLSDAGDPVVVTVVEGRIESIKPSGPVPPQLPPGRVCS
jgi:hypothetical protein